MQCTLTSQSYFYHHWTLFRCCNDRARQDQSLGCKKPARLSRTKCKWPSFKLGWNSNFKVWSICHRSAALGTIKQNWRRWYWYMQDVIFDVFGFVKKLQLLRTCHKHNMLIEAADQRARLRSLETRLDDVRFSRSDISRIRNLATSHGVLHGNSGTKGMGEWLEFELLSNN